MMRLAVLVALAGCDGVLHLDDIHPAHDAAIGGDTIDAPACYGMSGTGNSGLLQVCLTIPVRPSLTLTDGVSTTVCDQTVLQTDAAQSPVCVLAAQKISISGTAMVTGPLPLVLVGTDSVTIDAGMRLDVASHRNGQPGAGATAGPCELAGTAGKQGNGGSGGAGGSFGTSGGMGGANATVSGGIAAPVVALALIRGGCSGGRGGSNTAPVTGGDGGSPGGAVYIIAGKTITVSGSIDASGSGGGGGATGGSVGVYGSGGGGGASGGMIGLDAPNVTVTAAAALFANGGGGGGGGGDTGAGNPGMDPFNAVVAAPGGGGGSFSGGLNVGSGGAGFAGTAAAADGTGVNKVGGGGGGGAGYIHIYTTTPMIGATTTISPMAVVQ